MLILFHFFLLGLLSWAFYRTYQASPLRLYYWPALAVKLAAGIALGMLYFLHYEGGDTLAYHHDATELGNLARENFPAYLDALSGDYPEELDLVYDIRQERALFTAKVFSLFYLFTGNHYWITSCYVSLLAFLALFSLAHRMALFKPGYQKAAALAFLFWPSFVFWTSGLLKESLAIICIAFSVACFLPFLLAGKRVKGLEVLISLLLLFFLFQIKYYYVGLLVPVLFCLVLAVWAQRHFQLREYWAWLFFLFGLVAGLGIASTLHPNLGINRFLEVWVENYYLVSEASSAGGFVVFDGLKADWQNILKASPKAILAGLYAPLMQFDATNLLRMAASAENCLLVLLSLAGLAGWLCKRKGRLSLAVFATLLCILAFALIMSVAAPNYGTLLRYRISYQPFFVLLVLAGVLQFIRWLQERGKRTS